MNLTGDRFVTWSDPHAPTTVTTQKVFFGPDPFGLGGFQVAVANAATNPSRQAMRDLFSERKGKTQVQLVVVVVHDGRAHLFGPDPQAPVLELPVEQAQRQLQSVLSEPDVLAATERYAGFRKADDSTGVSGFTNSGLFATHHIKENVPKRADWDALGDAARALLGLRKKRLIEALGFRTHAGPSFRAHTRNLTYSNRSTRLDILVVFVFEDLVDIVGKIRTRQDVTGQFVILDGFAFCCDDGGCSDATHTPNFTDNRFFA